MANVDTTGLYSEANKLAVRAIMAPVRHEHSTLCLHYIIGGECDCRGYHSTFCAVYSGKTCDCGL